MCVCVQGTKGGVSYLLGSAKVWKGRDFLAKRGEVVLFVEGAGRGAVVMGEVGGGAVANQPK